jgi:pimeloyl-ACP methyl ester carboxylesterase
MSRRRHRDSADRAWSSASGAAGFSPKSPGWIRRFAQAAVLAAVLAGVVTFVSFGAIGFLMYKHSHPPRVAAAETPEALFTRYENVEFPSTDGIPLVGWWISGAPGSPVVILCHDLGESRSSLVGLSTDLAESGYSVLLFDFRGHGQSGGVSSFGILEKRDLLGAIDWLASRRDADAQHIGVVGVGMGAHAAILAGAERPQVRCLVLDSPYQDVATSFAAARLRSGTFGPWLRRAATYLYDMVYRVNSTKESAVRRVASLADKNLLFLAPRGRAATTRAMYESVPESRRRDKNLLLLEATRTSALYGEDRARYDREVVGFLLSYLPSARPQGKRRVEPSRTVKR